MDRVVHFEIPADNLERAKKFYKDIFGWDEVDIPGAGMPYTIVRTMPVDQDNMPTEAGAINGGLKKRDMKDEGTVITIDVPSIDSYIQKITKAGGKVVMPRVKVMDMGYNARVTDSEGNVIGLWETIKK